MARCKNCHRAEIVTNGYVRHKQRYQCKACGYNVVVGDDRMQAETAVKRAFAVILYALGKSSYGFLAKLFGVTPPAVHKWLQREADRLDELAIPGTIRDMECDEMGHFIGSQTTTRGSSKPWIVLQSEPWPGCSAVVMLQPSSGSTRRSNT